MKALVFRHNLAREAVSAIGGHVDRHAFVSRLAPVRLEDVNELPLPAQDWVRVETTFSGLCGSDVKQILLNGSRDNPLTALVSFPHVLGHEVVGRRADTGERVVLNPWLSCTPRGIDPPCPACQAGRYPWCRNFRSGDLPVSIHLGNCAAAAGAHAERFGAHVSQLFAIPDDVSDEAAVLADPVSVSLRSILLAPPPDGQAVLVYGSGTLAFAVIALLRHLYPGTEVWAATRPGARASLATRLGAHAVLSSSPDELVAQVARCLGTTPLVPWSKHDWLQDGPAVVYDTIGSTETVETSLRLLATGGTLVVSGVEPPKRFEWTPLYFKELRVIGSNGFGVEEVGGVAKHAMEHYFNFVADGLDLTPVITHRFPLERWDQAVLALKDSRRTGAVKVLLEPAAARLRAAGRSRSRHRSEAGLRTGRRDQFGPCDLPVDDVVGHLGKLAVVVARVVPQRSECVVHGHGQVLGEHALGLLDDHPAGQGHLELLGQQVALPECPFLDQRDRGHLRHGLRQVDLGTGKRLVAAAEQVQRADDVRAHPQRDGAHRLEARIGRFKREDRPAGPAAGRVRLDGPAGRERVQTRALGTLELEELK